MSLFDEIQIKSDEKAQERVNVCVIGRGGAGKSSLLNALTGTELFETGVKTDVTTESSTQEHGQIQFTDLPGYGTDKFRIESWKTQFSPEQYHLFLFVIDGKITSEDQEFAKVLASNKSTIIAVRTKDDGLKGNKKKGITKDSLRQDIKDDVKNKLDISDVIFTGQGEDEEDVYGVDLLKQKVLDNLDKAHRSAFELWAKSFSEGELESKVTLAKKKLESDVNAIIDRGLLGVRAVEDNEITWMYKNIQAIFNVTDVDISKHLNIYGGSQELLNALQGMPHEKRLIWGILTIFFPLLTPTTLALIEKADFDGLRPYLMAMTAPELQRMGEKMVTACENVAAIIIKEALTEKAEKLDLGLQ